MKTILFVMVLFGSAGVFAQIGKKSHTRTQPGIQVPAAVQQSFQKENPEAKDAHWSRTNQEWRANYHDNNRRTVDEYYRRNGLRNDLHRSLDRLDVPRSINSRVKSLYGGNYRVARIERSNEEPVFQIKVQKGPESRTLYMNERGEDRQYNDHHK